MKGSTSVKSSDRPRVLIIEDDEVLAHEMRRILVSAGYEVPAIASSGRQALEAVERHSPDLMVTDIELDDELDGVEVGVRTAAQGSTPIIYVTGHCDGRTLARAAGTNMFGYLLKPFTALQLRTTVAVALSRAAHLSAAPKARAGLKPQRALEEIARVLRASGCSSLGEAPWEHRPQVKKLSARELEIVRHLIGGARVATLARTLRISHHTVRNHLKAAFRKLEVHSQAELIDWASRRDLD